MACTHKAQIKVDIKLSAGDLAELWWQMSSSDQAKFFNRIGREDLLPMQLQYITEESGLGKLGRRAMFLIGEYAESDRYGCQPNK